MIKSIVIMAILISSAIFVLPLASSFSVSAASGQPKLFPPSVNKSLSVKWWQWLLSIPPGNNPILDNNPCDVKQSGPFFYLVGTFGGSAERNCTIPQGKAIFFPVINVVATLDKNDPAFDTIAEVKKAVADFINGATDLQVTVDGTDIKLSKLRVQSQVFKFKVGEDNILGAPAGTYAAVSDGYWVALHPLSVGEHTIHFAGKIGDFSVDVTYHITVQ
jgi:hypothetical protein